MRKIFFSIFTMVAMCLTAVAEDPMATDYTMTECDGSLMPYPTEINPAVFPDTLKPVFINHVGRHGARYPASAANCLKLRKALLKADSVGTITPVGRQLAKLNDLIIARSENQWGALDSLGMAEQRAIATRMFYNFGEIFSDGAMVNAISSYSPRAMMSMYSFVHQLDRMDNRINFVTSTGRINSALMRPFDTSEDYKNFRADNVYKTVYNDYFTQVCPVTAIKRVLGERYPFSDDTEMKDLAITEYYVIAGCRAMNINPNTTRYFSKEEYNALWSCFNLRQYLQRTATTLSTVPAEIASELVQDLISSTENFINGTNPNVCNLRFGHAETLMPLLSLMKLKGCYYMTNYFDTVGLHWKDFDVVPMAANLQMILFKSNTDRYYIRIDLNEKPIPLIPNSTQLYIPWGEARNYLTRMLPLIVQ